MKQVLLYLPVVHAGHEAFFARHGDAAEVLVLGRQVPRDVLVRQHQGFRRHGGRQVGGLDHPDRRAGQHDPQELGGPLRRQRPDVLGQALKPVAEPGPQDQHLRRVRVPGEQGLVARVHDREVQQYLLQLRDRVAEASVLRAEPALTAETGGAGLAMMMSRSRADVLTVAMRSSTSTRPQ